MTARILLDARKAGDFGIGVYIENLVYGLLKLRSSGAADLELTLLVPPMFLEAGAPIGVQEFIARVSEQVQLIPEPAKKYSLDEYLLLAGRQRRVLAAHDLYHSPHYTLPYFLSIPSVVTVHDVIHINQPETVYHRPLAQMMIRSAMRRAAHVVSVSEESVRQLVALSRGVRTPMTVVGNALQEGFMVLPRHEVRAFLRRHSYGDNSYCLFVGNERPHKGFAELLQAWSLLAAKQMPSSELPDLYVVGERFSEASFREVRRLGLRSRVKFLGRVSREALCNLYNGARLAAVPSREEGFGLVALEALGCGVPVVCTPHASFREVCAESAWYAEDYTASGLAEVLQQALSEAEECKRRVAHGLERVQRYTREETALKTCRVYQQVLGREFILAQETGARRPDQRIQGGRG